MFCKKCGKEIHDQAVVCIHCGCATENNVTINNSYNVTSKSYQQEEESAGLASAAMVCAFLVPIVGIILGIIGIATYKDPALKAKSGSAIGVSIIVWIACAVLLGIVYSLG